MPVPRLPLSLLVLVAVALATALRPTAQDQRRRWLAGDTHIHSQWSPGYDRKTDPPTYLRGADALYPTPRNATMARQHGLAWMVTTDHGGPTHSKLNRDEAYPELQQSRTAVPEVLQFYGMELNMPAMDHHTLIVPRADGERDMVYDIESRFDSADAWPSDPARSTEAARQAAMAFVAALPTLPLMFANHPSRSATGISRYGADEPRELRDNNTRAPLVYRGLEGGPGHQASGLAKDGSPRRNAQGDLTGFRGGYSRPGAHTIGGFDQMTAIVGGLWDSMLTEGRRFWIVASSDSHVHYTEATRQGSDFWPGEFHKTYVKARHTYDDVLDGLRQGRAFAVAGDLISELDLTARAGQASAELGGTLKARPGQAVSLAIRFRDPARPNHAGRSPAVTHIDVIVGAMTGTLADPQGDRTPSTRVVMRLTPTDWTCKGEVCSVTKRLPGVAHSQYVRLRGTSTQDDEPQMDTAGESPWDDLWFYSNPIFIERGVIVPPARVSGAEIRVPGLTHTHDGRSHTHAP